MSHTETLDRIAALNGRAEDETATAAEKPERPKATATHCANGHEKAEWWTETSGGRKYCRLCAREASVRTRAKNPRPRKRIGLSEDALAAILKWANQKNTKGELRDELLAFVEASNTTAS